MKGKKILFFLFVCLFFLVGCGKNQKDVVFKKISEKINGSNSYNLKGDLEIINNENSYQYDVEVVFLKENNFKVSLKNKTNNHEQIILRNNDGVFVLTPSLNKSFKFQSEWPYNNSQSYLLQNLLNDINNDTSYSFEENSDGYIINTKVNYSNNKELVNQKIYVNNKYDIYKVEIFDSNNLLKLKMNINNIDYNQSVNVDDFKVEKIINVSFNNDNIVTVSKLNDITYPMYIPQNTYLHTQDKVSKNNGERVIMTFAGDYPFMLIQETVNNDENYISVYGEPYQLSNSIGILDDSSLSWINNGIEYYLVSNSLNSEQLVNVANSLSVAAINK